MATGFVAVATALLILTPQYPFYLFALILCLLAIYIVLYSRVSYFLAHGNKLILRPDGMEYHYLGIHGFAKWSEMLYFDVDKERAWLNTAYQTSDLRSMRVTILFFSWRIPIRNKSVIGIRLKNVPMLHKSPLAKIPDVNLDFIPLSLLVDIPRMKDGLGDIDKFIQTKFGQDLSKNAPYLFDEKENAYRHRMLDGKSKDVAKWYAEQEAVNAHLFE
jgi:hypothetical protein